MGVIVQAVNLLKERLGDRVVDSITFRDQTTVVLDKSAIVEACQILRDHALKNAMLPMITLITLNLGYTVGGAIQVETVFSWPGLGRLIFEAVGDRDFPVLQGAFLLIAVSVIGANLLADLLYTVLDPRVRAE